MFAREVDLFGEVSPFGTYLQLFLGLHRSWGVLHEVLTCA